MKFVRVDRKTVKIIVAIVVLIAIGFCAGFYLFIPLNKWWFKYRSTKNYKNEQQYLSENFLHKKAPSISTYTLDGEKWSLQDQKNKLVLVFFWATTCKYSRQAIPEMEEIYYTYNDRDDFIIAGVSLDQDRDMLNCYSSTKKIPWTILYEDGKGWDNSFSRALEVHSIPSVWIIDKEGIIRGLHMNLEEIDTTVATLLEGNDLTTSTPDQSRNNEKSKKNTSVCTE